MAEDLLNRLISLSKSDALPMHMPGHKRNGDMADYLDVLGAKLDITEIDGFDDLHASRGVLRDGMERTARLWGADRSFWSVNGATLGVLAGILGVCPRGSRVVMARNCHISVYHAVEIGGLKASYVLPEYDFEFGINASVAPEAVARALNRYPDAKLLIVTSPTYEGVISDIRSICALAHARGVPVLVDEAHGAHLGLTDDFPMGAVRAGADIVVNSLHKTLPSLTQTAILHVSGALADRGAIERYLDVLETSSPSYLLMASIDGCVRMLQREKTRVLGDWKRALNAFARRTEGLSCLRVLRNGDGGAHPNIFAFDPSKLVVSCAGTGMTGTTLAEDLRKRFRIEVEMASRDYVVAMTGAGDTVYTLSRFADALLAIDGALTRACARQLGARPLRLPARRYFIGRALSKPSEMLRLSESTGRVCAEYLFAYPPGIPLIVPGEIIGARMLAQMDEMLKNGVRLRAGDRDLDDDVCVVTETIRLTNQERIKT